MPNASVRQKQRFSSNRPLDTRRRKEYMNEMSTQSFDLFIIGGGITGAGIALDAASRGLRVALVEMQDYAGGTSSRSTKLVHGGLRYLKQFEIGMVAEVGKERAIVYENGPHVTTPERMLLPFYRGGTFGPLTTSLALRVYDFLAGVKKSERRKLFNVQDTLRKEPLLKQEGLRGSGSYVEYRTDDARLTLEVMKKAAEHGALCVNYVSVESFLYENGRISGAVVRDTLDGEVHEVKATWIINATGPWVDELRELDQSKEGKTLRLTKGVHLVFDQGRFPLKQAIYADSPDGRMVFAIPRDGKTYFGTTDTDYSGDLVQPPITAKDRSYLLEAVNDIFPTLNLQEGDIESSWAGLRPLIQQPGKKPSEVSRRDEIFISSSGLLSIAGGKLTGYRKMAENVVNRVGKLMAAEGQRLTVPCITKYMPISGGSVGGSQGFQSYVQECIKDGRSSGLTKEDAIRIALRYGSNAPKLFELAFTSQAFAKAYGLPLVLAAELQYAIEEEGALKPEDFWVRRTGKLYFNVASVSRWKAEVCCAMGELLGWSEERLALYEEELDQLIKTAVTPYS